MIATNITYFEEHVTSPESFLYKELYQMQVVIW